ncbi:MAG: protoporphyrinogen/coproporphyrinogen oxidase [Acidobacteriota bacterium]|jgi:oxygen-dependent protoporphyrinogen oxidase
MNRIVIIGGGISGLAAAHHVIELNQAAHVTLIEASDRLGGTIQTDHRDGFLIERGPDSFISEKPHAIALAKRLGIESQLIQTNEEYRRSFIVRGGRLRAVPEGFQLLAPSRMWPFITSDIFSITGKVRMAADLLLPRRSTNGSTDESLASFVRRRLGEEALARMAQPMVGGIYTADPETLSLRATLPRFLDMEQKHRSLILAMARLGRAQKTGTSGARYSLFVSFAQGMEVLVDALTQATRTNADLRVSTRAQRLTYDHGWTITTDKDEQIKADAVFLALPAYVAASLLEDTHKLLAQKLRKIKYASTATINFGYRRAAIKHPLNGFGFVVPFIEKRSLIACTFSSVKFGGRAPEGHVLLRAFAGGALQPEIFALDEAEMARRVEVDLRELLGISEDPLFVEVAKWERSMPQYEVGHLDRMNEIEKLATELPGLSLAGNAYRGAGVPDCVASGEASARECVNPVGVGLH